MASSSIRPVLPSYYSPNNDSVKSDVPIELSIAAMVTQDVPEVDDYVEIETTHRDSPESTLTSAQKMVFENRSQSLVQSNSAKDDRIDQTMVLDG